MRPSEKFVLELMVSELNTTELKKLMPTTKESHLAILRKRAQDLIGPPLVTANIRELYFGFGRNSISVGIPSAMICPPEVLPRFAVIKHLISPVVLQSQGTSLLSEANFKFSLTCENADQIWNCRNSLPFSELEFQNQIQMRFSVISPSHQDGKDSFPAILQVKVNDKHILLRSPIPSADPGIWIQRFPAPVEITRQCRIIPDMVNNIDIVWGSNSKNVQYVVAVDMVHQLDAKELLDELHKRVRPYDHTRTLIRNEFFKDYSLSDFNLPLVCPLTKKRLEIPCRPSTCRHLQCFDLSYFLEVNAWKRNWFCPVCDTLIGYEHLAVDGFVAEILNSAPRDCVEVEINAQGRWFIIEPEKNKSKYTSANTDYINLQNTGYEDEEKVHFHQYVKDGSLPKVKLELIDRTRLDYTYYGSTTLPKKCAVMQEVESSFSEEDVQAHEFS